MPKSKPKQTHTPGYSNLILSVAFLCIGIVLGASYTALTNSKVNYPYGNKGMYMDGMRRMDRDRDHMPVAVEPYSADDSTATFKVMPMRDEKVYSEVTYWTDDLDACDAMTADYSEYVEVPVDSDVEYTFFQFTGENGEKTPIYATSHKPIFECGAMAQ